MATAAFKSSTKRSTFGATHEDAGSSNRSGALRRSRSLSRYSGRFPPPPLESDELPTPRGRLINKETDFPEISLDDLADEFFRRKEEEEEVRPAVGRSRRRDSDFRYMAETDASRRWGRSVSRTRERAAGEGKGVLENNRDSKGVPAGRSRRQRSVSVSRYRNRDSESHTSAPPNDESWDDHHNGSGSEKTIHAVYDKKRVMVKTEPMVIVNGDDS